MAGEIRVKSMGVREARLMAGLKLENSDRGQSRDLGRTKSRKRKGLVDLSESVTEN